ncbi:hypothetical protein AG1IA_08917 [Rhizoctonia solani AG-1 IA]|uniref:Uncharacterized protein n=1 Tax=Thanatephorus cucumeris (strain AG1-IA) TaxID=983506 RepID=L8WJY7_THACA|nr:hypothetical protein AG1IA_08917 [Rhizoctonia solani AG-1 IA]
MSAMSKGNGSRVRRTKPAPRTISNRSVVSSGEVSGRISDFALASDSVSAVTIIRDTTVVTCSNHLEISSDKPYLNPSITLPDSFSSYSSRPFVPSVPSSHLFNATSKSFNSPNIIPLSDDRSLITTRQMPQAFLFRRAGNEDEDEDEDEGNEHDLEGIRALLCTNPTLDKNAEDNSLPFVLYSCESPFLNSRWAIARVFEPLKIVHTMRERLVALFSSDNTRTRTILIANVMDAFARNLVIDGARKFIVDHLVSDGQQRGYTFMATLPMSCSLESDRHNAIPHGPGTQVFSLQIFTQPLVACLQSLDYAAPVFRYGCPELPGQPVNIANIMLESNISLQFFVNLDVLQSVTTGNPTYFKYEVPFSLELCERLYQQNNHGSQWHLGFPGPFALLFAWINSLSEIPETAHNSSLVTWVETNLPQIKLSAAESGDPLLRLARTLVQECWSANDPRVIQAQKGFMRLFRGMKPGRYPDAHLSPPVVIAGVATTEERDRETLRRRILGVQEFAKKGTVGSDFMLELEDIWNHRKIAEQSEIRDTALVGQHQPAGTCSNFTVRSSNNTRDNRVYQYLYAGLAPTPGDRKLNLAALNSTRFRSQVARVKRVYSCSLTELAAIQVCRRLKGCGVFSRSAENFTNANPLNKA